ncbi:protein of unknown function [Tindallia magadiensis]|uniref:DUF3870 domain-containing protein n=1 Tax=Tindallia magadiensis TaxID=69895 RepID=A0A1I3BBT0_9FIRM|nr:DUF3870 domain-containing protein [Tindallia magadiensis]SFH59566.1 protein of unknown function [Tindallia magadiensis]
MVKLKEKEIFISGYAKPPENTTASQLYKIIAVGLRVERKTGIIVEADSSMITDVSKSFVKNALEGKNLVQIEEIEEMFHDNYFGSAKKALITAIKNCHLRYCAVIDNQMMEPEDD